MVSIAVASRASEPAAPAPSLAPAMAAQAASMPAYRVDAFRAYVAARMRAGATPELLIQEQQALAKVLTSGDFLGKMAACYTKEMQEQQPNPDYAVQPDGAIEEMHAILRNRAVDCMGFVALLADANFLATAEAEAKQPAPAAKPYELPPEKIEEAIHNLVQPDNPVGAESPPHVAMSARGQREGHQALANMFRPNDKGVLWPYFIEALVKAWPEATGAQVQALAADWLKARHDPAHATADGMAQDGIIYREAMRRSEALQQKKIDGAVLPVLATAPAQPLAQVQAPTPPTQKLAANAALAMEV